MTIEVTAVQLEVVDQGTSAARVVAVQAETMSVVQEFAPVKAHAAQLEYSSYLADPVGHCRAHGVQLEFVSHLKDPPLHCEVHATQLEVMNYIRDSQTNVIGIYVEVLRTVTDKKRRSYTNVVAN